MKKIYIIIAIALTCNFAQAQQDVQFTQYMFNTSSINPGYTGSRNAISTLALFRTQWVGFDGAPKTQTFNINSPLLNDKIGVGLSVINDKVGPLNHTSIFADFAYRIKFTDAQLAFGLKGGTTVLQAEFSSLTLINEQDEQFQNNISSDLLPNFGFGIYYHTDNYFLGFSTPKLLQNEVDMRTGDITTAQVGVEKLHYFFIGGYIFPVNPFIKFKPTTQLKFTYGGPPSLDLNASFLFYEKLWLGTMYRIGDAFGAIVQFQFTDQLRGGYSYDITLTPIRHYSSGSHEVMLGYDFKFSKSKIRSPRYF